MVGQAEAAITIRRLVAGTKLRTLKVPVAQGIAGIPSSLPIIIVASNPPS